VKHGSYSTVNHTRLADLIADYADYEEDPDPLDIEPELAAHTCLAYPIPG
jgi:hypothetical protein